MGKLGSFPRPNIVLNSLCDAGDPPDYCDEAGSCFDADIDDDTDEAVLEALELMGVLTTLRDERNFDRNEWAREEHGGFYYENSEGDYVFDRLTDDNPTLDIDRDQCSLAFNIPNVPTSNLGGAVFVHTHPYSEGETQNWCPTTPTYKSKPGDEDRPTLRKINQATGIDQGLIIDKDSVVFFTPNDDEEPVTYPRCGY